LISILENEGAYQPMAVDAAKKEFQERALSIEDIRAAKEMLIAAGNEKKNKKARIKTFENKIRSTGHTVLDTLNPIQSGAPSTKKSIRLILLVLSGMFLFQLVKNFQFYTEYIKDIAKFPLESISQLLPQIILPISLFAFWKRKRSGWILLTGLVTFFAAEKVLSLTVLLSQPSPDLNDFVFIFPRPSPFTYLLPLVFLFGLMYLLYKKGMRNTYKISNQTMGLTICITVIVLLALLLSIP
jgi:hypothetical protein